MTRSQFTAVATSEQAVREVAAQLSDLDLDGQWLAADRMARLHHRRARQTGNPGDRVLATEHRQLAAQIAKQIMAGSGVHPRTLRRK